MCSANFMCTSTIVQQKTFALLFLKMMLEERLVDPQKHSTILSSGNYEYLQQFGLQSFSG